MTDPSIRAKAARIRLVVTDIDGVWTDGCMYYSAEGEAMKAFSTYDGLGAWLLEQAGIPVAVITGEDSAPVAARFKKLGLDEVHAGIRDKLATLELLLEKYNCRPEEVAYIGDDLNDIPCMQVAGLTACPATTPAFHLLKPDILLDRGGGEGAFREFADLILASKT